MVLVREEATEILLKRVYGYMLSRKGASEVDRDRRWLLLLLLLEKRTNDRVKLSSPRVRINLLINQLVPQVCAMSTSSSCRTRSTNRLKRRALPVRRRIHCKVCT